MKLNYYWLFFCCIFAKQALAEQILTEQTEMSFCFEEWQPYAYTDDNGHIVGHSVDSLREKLRQANISFKFTELSFPICAQEVLSGKIDFILHVDINDDFALLERPINHWQLTFAVSKDNEMSYEKLLASQGQKILIARTYSYPQLLLDKLEDMSANIIKVSYYTGELNALRRLFYRLEIGQAQAMVVDKIWAQDVVKKYQLPVKVFEQTVVQVPQFIGYNAKNKKLAQQLEQIIR